MSCYFLAVPVRVLVADWLECGFLFVLRKSICDLGNAGAQSGRPLAIGRKARTAADWMVANNVAAYNQSGQLVLHSSSLIFTTNLGSPSLVQEPPITCHQSLWSLRRKLNRLGWTPNKSSRDCSVQFKIYNSSNTSQMYLAILLDRNLPAL